MAARQQHPGRSGGAEARCWRRCGALVARQQHPGRSRGSDTMSLPVIGVGFAPSLCSLNATVRHASMLASAASCVAVLRLCAVSATRAFGPRQATSGHVGPFGHLGTTAPWHPGTLAPWHVVILAGAAEATPRCNAEPQRWALTLSLRSYAGFDAGLHLCAVSARHLCSVAVLTRCDCAPCFYAGFNRVSRCSVAFVCSLGHSGIRATSGHVGPFGHSGTVATWSRSWWAGSSRAAEQGHWARLPGGAALRGRAGRAEPRARRDPLVPGICHWWSWVWA